MLRKIVENCSVMSLKEFFLLENVNSRDKLRVRCIHKFMLGCSRGRKIYDQGLGTFWVFLKFLIFFNVLQLKILKKSLIFY